MNDGTCAQKEEGFEEGVIGEVKETRRVSRETAGEDHVTQLRASGVGNDFFQIVLHEARGCCHKGRSRTDEGDERKNHRSGFKEEGATNNEKDARRNHRCRMNKGGNGCRSFHRVRKSGVKSDLRRFSHRTYKEQKGDGRDGMWMHVRGETKDNSKVHRLKAEEGEKNSDGQGKIGDTIDNHCFHGCLVGSDTRKSEINEKVRAKTDSFSAQKKANEIFRGNEEKHKEGEKREVTHKTRQVGVFTHVLNGVEMHKSGDREYYNEHHIGECV